MSDETKEASAPAPTATADNIKAEMQRKYSNLEQGLTATNQKLAELMNVLNSPKPPVQAQPEDLEDLMYKNPQAFIQKVTSQVEAKVEQRLNVEKQKQNEIQTTISNLVSDFPELNKVEHPLYEKAQEIYGSMTEAQKANPAYWESAVYRAAAETGIKPKKMRKKEESENDDFVLGGNKRNKSSKQENDEVSVGTIEFAKRLGLDVSKKETLERLKARSKKNFGGYSS